MPVWLRDLIYAFIVIFAAWLISRLIHYLLRPLVKRFVERTETNFDNVLATTIDTPLQLLILLIGIQIALAQMSVIPDSWLTGINNFLFVLYAFLVSAFLYRVIDGLISWYEDEVVHKTVTNLDDQFLGLFRRLVLAGLLVTAVVIIFGHFGIEVSTLVTTLGIGSLAVALAAQDTLGNMFAGLTLMMDRPFKIGDRVALLDIDTWGDVIEVGLRSTRIMTRDDRTVTVPNSVIGNGLIVNYSVPSTRYRVQTHLGVAYGTDVDEARAVMIEAIRAEDWVMKDERIEALFLEFGEFSLKFRVRCWIEHYVETRRIIDKMNTVLYQALNEAGIVMPMPQRDVRLLSSQEVGSGNEGSIE